MSLWWRSSGGKQGLARRAGGIRPAPHAFNQPSEVERFFSPSSTQLELFAIAAPPPEPCLFHELATLVPSAKSGAGSGGVSCAAIYRRCIGSIWGRGGRVLVRAGTVTARSWWKTAALPGLSLSKVRFWLRFCDGASLSIDSHLRCSQSESKAHLRDAGSLVAIRRCTTIACTDSRRVRSFHAVCRSIGRATSPTGIWQ